MLNTKIKFQLFVCAILTSLVIAIFPSSINPGMIVTAEEKKPIAQETPKIVPVPEKKEEIPAVYQDDGKATYYKSNRPGKKRPLTAAHKYLPKGTILRVEALDRKGYEPIEVEVNDRLPDIPQNNGIVIDLDINAALAMSPEFKRTGVIKVRITEIK